MLQITAGNLYLIAISCAYSQSTISLLLGYVVSGSVTKGYVGCHCRGPALKSRRSKVLKKNLWDNRHRKWLNVNHPFRTNTAVFASRVENGLAPTRPSADEAEAWGNIRERWQRSGASLAHVDPARVHGIKRVSSLMSLPYWKVQAISPFITLYLPLYPLRTCS